MTSAARFSWAGRQHRPPSCPALALLIINHKLLKEAEQGGLCCLSRGVMPTDWESLYLHSHMNDSQARAGMLTS